MEGLIKTIEENSKRYYVQVYMRVRLCITRGVIIVIIKRKTK